MSSRTRVLSAAFLLGTGSPSCAGSGASGDATLVASSTASATSSPSSAATAIEAPTASAPITATASAGESATASAPTAVPTSSAAALVAPPCDGPNRRLYGSTCCEVQNKDYPKFPGMPFLRCHGPQIGKSCTSKLDCDVVCSCDPSGSPSQDRAGPPDGAPGMKGVCGGELQVGRSMCEIDERGIVTHVIVD